jgi:hypothetical protein
MEITQLDNITSLKKQKRSLKTFLSTLQQKCIYGKSTNGNPTTSIEVLLEVRLGTIGWFKVGLQLG